MVSKFVTFYSWLVWWILGLIKNHTKSTKVHIEIDKLRVTTRNLKKNGKVSYVLSCVVSCMWWQLISVADDQNNCYHHTCMLHKQTILVAEYI